MRYPELPTNDADFTPDMARAIIGIYQSQLIMRDEKVTQLEAQVRAAGKAMEALNIDTCLCGEVE